MDKIIGMGNALVDVLVRITEEGFPLIAMQR